MKKLLFVLITGLIGLSFIGAGNIGKDFPKAEFKDLDGKTLKTQELKLPAIVSFWSTTCIPCMKELKAIDSKYDDWKKGTDFEVYAISTDDERFAARVPLIVNKKGWKFPVLTDQPKAVFNSLGVTNNPYTVVINKAGKIVYEHASYVEGDEEELIKVIKGL